MTVNTCLLNIFYGFEAGKVVHALVLLLGLLYLLLEEYPRLVAFFLAKPAAPVLQVRGVYFDRRHQRKVFYYDGEKMRPGNFVYDPKSSLVRFPWHYPAGANDALTAGVGVFSGEIGLDGKMGDRPIRMELERKP